MNELEHLRYPTGRFEWGRIFTFDEAQAAISKIEVFPALFRKEVEKMTPQGLDTPYREGGWTGRQVIHHVADSHLNGYPRFKMAVTEDTPTIKPYLEQLWAPLEDVKTVPVEVSVQLIEGLHQRWVAFLKSLKREDFDRAIIHPEHGRRIPLTELTCCYAWHGLHHLGHLKIINGF